MPGAFAIRTAALIVRHGGIVAYPTEGVYGLGCDPYDEAALERLLALKRRSPEQGLILIASRYSQLAPFVAPLDNRARARLDGAAPVTWIVPAQPRASRLITGRHASVAVRITRHPVAHALCERCEAPVVSTSANLSGRPPARTALAARQRFGRHIDFVLAGAVGDLDGPTPIRDLATGARLR